MAQDWKTISARIQKRNQDSYSYRNEMLHILKHSLSFDGYCCTVVNPYTLTSVGAITEESIEPIHLELLAYEYDGNDTNSYKDLIKAPVKVGRLSDHFGSNASKRYEDILKPNLFLDEIRVPLMVHNKCYGFLTLFRKAGEDDPVYFSDENIVLLQKVGPIMGKALQDYYHALLVKESEKNSIGNGVIILNKSLQIQSMNEAGVTYLNILRELEHTTDTHSLPKPIQAICARLIAMEKNTPPVLIPLINSSHIIATASFLNHASEVTPHIVISLNKASPGELSFHLMEAYSLTDREQQIVLECLTGAPSKEIASNLNISYYTVQDHFKLIFQKVGVTSRNELIWELFSKYH